jgi:hypothetical protein
MEPLAELSSSVVMQDLAELQEKSNRSLLRLYVIVSAVPVQTWYLSSSLTYAFQKSC